MIRYQVSNIGIEYIKEKPRAGRAPITVIYVGFDGRQLHVAESSTGHPCPKNWIML